MKELISTIHQTIWYKLGVRSLRCWQVREEVLFLQTGKEKQPEFGLFRSQNREGPISRYIWSKHGIHSEQENQTAVPLYEC